MIWFLTASASACKRSISSRCAAAHSCGSRASRSRCAVLQVIHLAEEMPFLLRREQGKLVQAGQVGRQTFGRPGPAGSLADRLPRSHNLGDGRRVIETRIAHEFELRLQQVAGPYLMDDAYDTRPAQAELCGQDLDGESTPRLAVDQRLGCLVRSRPGRPPALAPRSCRRRAATAPASFASSLGPSPPLLALQPCLLSCRSRMKSPPNHPPIGFDKGLAGAVGPCRFERCRGKCRWTPSSFFRGSDG